MQINTKLMAPTSSSSHLKFGMVFHLSKYILPPQLLDGPFPLFVHEFDFFSETVFTAETSVHIYVKALSDLF